MAERSEAKSAKLISVKLIQFLIFNANILSSDKCSEYYSSFSLFIYLIPSFDDHSLSEREFESLISVVAGIELFAGF